MIKVNGLDIINKTYSDGSVGIQMPSVLQNASNVIVDAGLKTPEDLLVLLQVIHYFKTCHTSVHLNLLYAQYLRQDRFQKLDNNHFAPNAVEAFIRMLGSSVQSLTLFDPHSDVVRREAINYRIVVGLEPQYSLASTLLDPSEFDIVVIPDAGATAKSTAIAEVFNKPCVKVGEKTRNPETHKVEFKMLDSKYLADLKGKRVLIADDIIDYGTTIRDLTHYLKTVVGVSEIVLYISHAILPINERINPPNRFSFALEHVDKFYAYNLFNIEGNNTYPSLIKYKNLI